LSGFFIAQLSIHFPFFRYFHKMKRLQLLLFVIMISACASVPDFMGLNSAEKDENAPDISYDKEVTDTLPDAELKTKKNVYYGERTRKAFTNPRGNTYELFNTLREPVKVDNYVREIYYHDRQGNRIVSVAGKGQVLENVLHGPYTKEVNEVIVEKGMFYKGMKHEIWMIQNRDSTLADKVHYHMGWFRDSEISYYDDDTKSRLKEVIPIRYGKKEGNYYRFFENGKIAVQGKYAFDQRVGVWEEFYNISVTAVKREIQFRPEFYMKEFEPYIRKEWTQGADLIYLSPKLNQ